MPQPIIATPSPGSCATPQDATSAARSWAETGLVMLVLFVGMAATTWGAWQHWDALQVGWQPDGRSAVAWAAALAAGALALASLLRLPLKATLLMLAVLTAASAVGMGAVASTLLILASAAQIGLLLLASRQDGVAHPMLLCVAAVATGLAAFAGLLQASGRIPLHYPALYMLLLAMPFAAMPERVRLAWRGLGQDLRLRAEGPVDGWNVALWTVAAAGALIRLLGALAPEAGLDALDMHLQMPAMVIRDHAWVPAQTGFVWAWMPMSADWLYALAYGLGGEPAARLLNYAADALVLVACAGTARLVAGPRAGAIAAVLYSTLPVTYLLGTSLFVENLWTLWLGCALLMATALRRDATGMGGYVALGLLFGAALAAKVMTLFWAPVALYFAYERLRQDPRAALRLLGVTTAAALMVGGWPYVAAWLDTGNPVFPFMNDVFKSPLYPSAAAFDSPYSESVSWRLLYDLTFSTDKYLEALPGSFGLAMLALLPAGLLATALRYGRWGLAMVVAALLFVAVTFSFTAYLRYIAPAFPVLALLAAIGLQAIRPPILRGVVATVGVVTGIAGLLFFANSTWWYRGIPPRGPVDPVAYQQWETMMRPEARIVRRANELGLRHVLWLGRGFYAGLQARVTTNSWHQQSGWTELTSTADLERWAAQQGFDGIVLAAGMDPCTTVLCAAMDRLGEPELVSGSAKLFVLQPGRLDGLRPLAALPEPQYLVEKLKDTELRETQPGWAGNGEWDKTAGTMRVSVDKLFSQAVGVSARRQYLYSIRARCHGAPIPFRMQVNWLAADGAIIDSTIGVEECKPKWDDYTLAMVAPPGAQTAIVYAVGHTANGYVDVDVVSFRE